MEQARRPAAQGPERGHLAVSAVRDRSDRQPRSQTTHHARFKIATAKLAEPVKDALRPYAALEARRAKVPRRIPVGEVVVGEVIQLAAERKHLTNVIKRVAYQAETDLVRRITPHYRRADDEARTLVQSMLANAADIVVTTTELRVTFAPLNSPHRTSALVTLCAEHAGGVLANSGALRNPDVLAGVSSELESTLATGEAQRFDRRIARLLDDLRLKKALQREIKSLC